MAGSVETFTDGNWQEVLKSPRPVLVDFWGEWCMPCKTLVPILEAAAGQYDGRVRIGKFDVGDNPGVPVQYNITTLPTLLVIKGGVVAEQHTGLISKENLQKLLDRHL